jgi:hypothetical protein
VFHQVLWPRLTSPHVHDIGRPPRVRASSFLRFLRHLPDQACWLRALQCCACLPSCPGLICRFCSSVPDFAVPLPSLRGSLHTSLRLANRLHQLAYEGFAPSGIIWYLRYQLPMPGTHRTVYFIAAAFGISAFSVYLSFRSSDNEVQINQLRNIPWGVRKYWKTVD